MCVSESTQVAHNHLQLQLPYTETDMKRKEVEPGKQRDTRTGTGCQWDAERTRKHVGREEGQMGEGQEETVGSKAESKKRETPKEGDIKGKES